MQITSDDWSEFASSYHSRVETTTRKFAIDSFLLSKHYLSSLSSPSTRVSALDIACGSGALERALFQLQRDRPAVLESLNMDLIATDYSSGMVDLVNDYIKANSNSGPKNLKITTQVQDGQTLPLVNPNSMDIIYSIFGIFMFPDRKSTFESISRVLKQNGYLIFTSWTGASPKPTNESSQAGPKVLLDIVGHVMTLLPDRLRPPIPQKLPTTPTTPPPSVMDFTDADKIKTQFELYGGDLKYIKTFKSTTTMVFGDMNEFWMFMLETSPPFAKVFGQLTVDEKKAMMGKLKGVFGVESENEPILLDAVALITVAKNI
ncbi:S-adenosyl-L-methionine-dependent methyltransferase [Paraphysoderma sedebokerense]|nr:S-adenosyl-L-methionine-dependent methyltransferase [Paraphysoderma sedebokerense]